MTQAEALDFIEQESRKLAAGPGEAAEIARETLVLVRYAREKSAAREGAADG